MSVRARVCMCDCMANYVLNSSMARDLRGLLMVAAISTFDTSYTRREIYARLTSASLLLVSSSSNNTKTISIADKNIRVLYRKGTHAIH